MLQFTSRVIIVRSLLTSGVVPAVLAPGRIPAAPVGVVVVPIIRPLPEVAAAPPSEEEESEEESEEEPEEELEEEPLPLSPILRKMGARAI